MSRSSDEANDLVSDDAPLPLPTSFSDAVRREFARILTTPFEVPIVVAVNGALMSSAWFFLPTKLRDALFTLHNSLAYALVLAAWMYSDVPATNVLGPDATRIGGALDDPVMFRRLLYAKNVVLWSLVTPVCILIALVSMGFSHDHLATVYSIIWIGIVPFGLLAISGWVGIVFPYHPMPIRYRVLHRRPYRRMVYRWLTLVVTPYVLVPFIGVALMAPSLLLWGFTSSHGLSRQLPDHDLGLGVALACVVAIIATVGGHRVSWWLVTRRREKLAPFLADPTAG